MSRCTTIFAPGAHRPLTTAEIAAIPDEKTVAEPPSKRSERLLERRPRRVPVAGVEVVAALPVDGGEHRRLRQRSLRERLPRGRS